MIRFNTNKKTLNIANNQTVKNSGTISEKCFDTLRYNCVFYTLNTPGLGVTPVNLLLFKLLLYPQAFFVNSVHQLGNKGF
jgi:hypothetical protein